ncbi:MAG: AIR synthase related protein, partial [Rhizobium ruizarguesonis]
MVAIDIKSLAAKLSTSSGIAAKQDIGTIAARLGLQGQQIAVGDDCAALPDGDDYLLFAIEGFMNEFVAADPWFAGWCGVMVNISDIVAMGGRPIAVVDAVWANGEAGATPVLEGMRAASSAFGVPIVGGHTNIRSERGQLSVAILGRAKKLLTSFDAKAGDVLVAAIDHRGRYREPFS